MKMLVALKLLDVGSHFTLLDNVIEILNLFIMFFRFNNIHPIKSVSLIFGCKI